MHESAFTHKRKKKERVREGFHILIIMLMFERERERSKERSHCRLVIDGYDYDGALKERNGDWSWEIDKETN